MLRDYCKNELTVKLSLPVDVNTVSLFLANLQRRGYAASTILTHSAALSYIHKLNNWPDPANSFVVKSLLNSIKKCCPKSLAKLSIPLHMLHELLKNLQTVMCSKYDECLYKAIFLMQYHACARVGELVMSGKNHQNVLKVNQITFCNDAILVDFLFFKHNTEVSSEVITIESIEGSHCPVSCLQLYMQKRGENPGFLFITSGGKPVTRTMASHALKLLVTAAGYDCKRYDTHGLRYGRASQAAEEGWSETQIQQLGRWKSNAYKKYIRRPALARNSSKS